MASILQTIVQNKHYCFVDRLDSWQQGVTLSTKALVADGSVDADYAQQIIACIEKFGPYVVFENEVAMPHCQAKATGVHKTGIGFLRSKEPVSFGTDSDGEEKFASLFFTLAVHNESEHLHNIQQLAGLFCNEELLEALKAASSPEDLLAADAAFPISEI